MAREPLKVFRLRCGEKVHSPWLTDNRRLVEIGIRKGLIYTSEAMGNGLGPLTWIEHGERKYPRSRTIPQPRYVSGLG